MKQTYQNRDTQSSIQLAVVSSDGIDEKVIDLLIMGMLGSLYEAHLPPNLPLNLPPWVDLTHLIATLRGAAADFNILQKWAIIPSTGSECCEVYVWQH